MLENYNDISARIQRPLIKPGDLFGKLAASERVLNTIHQTRKTVEAIIHGVDDRLLVVVGPCSIHHPQAALEYGSLLAELAAQYIDDLVIIMRVYFEKPRTTLGWKGLIIDPHLDGSFDINHGLHLARQLLLDLAQLKIPAATEFLDTLIPIYLKDLISWGAIGARTSESQIHRELASGLPMPIGFKNNTDGNIKIAVDAADAARFPHPMLTIDNQGMLNIINSTGNPHTHIILRGATHSPNYEINHIKYAKQLLNEAKLTTHIMIDCSHGNSMKHYRNQHVVASYLTDQISNGIKNICGIMIESNLIAGNQRLEKNTTLRYGQSITDECVGWNETVSMIEMLAGAVKKRRSAVS